MRTLRALILLLLMLVTVTVVTGCRGGFKDSRFGKFFGGKQQEPMALQGGIESSVLPEPIRGGQPAQEVGDLKRVYFLFDSADLLEPAKEQLRANAAWMRANPAVHVQIEGHCDERGTADYNYALGQSRADAARALLMEEGVDPGRLHTISYGADRPADSGSGEMAYARNRRAQFLIYGGM